MSDSFVRIILHVIFSTKDRAPYLADNALRHELHSYLGGIVNAKGGQTLGVGGVDDHVHMLLIMPKAEVPVDTIRDLKRAATLWIKKREPSLRHFRWQRGYGAFSVGQGETGAIQKYINGQEERHRNESFKEEFVKFLKKYGFPYDESKMWM